MSTDDSKTNHVIVLVHGIRDRALWQNTIRKCLQDNGFKIVEPTNFGRFDLFRFLIPIAYFRNRAIEEVWRQLTIIRADNPQARISIIAHSFGTFVIAHIIKRNFDVGLHRVIFCGSVVPYDFRFEDMEGRFDRPILNEVGTRDIWPAIAETVTWGYGSPGTYGFRRARIVDRWHNGAHHGYFLTRSFCEKYWVPFLGSEKKTDGGADEAEKPKWWLTLLSIIQPRYLILALLVVMIFWCARAYYVQGNTFGYRFGPDGADRFFWAGGLTEMIKDSEECGMTKPICESPTLSKLLTGRRHLVLRQFDARLKQVVSCENFAYEGVDPVQALETFRVKFKTCLGDTPSSAMIPNMNELKTAADRNGRTWLICGCSPDQQEKMWR